MFGQTLLKKGIFLLEFFFIRFDFQGAQYIYPSVQVGPETVYAQAGATAYQAAEFENSMGMMEAAPAEVIHFPA